MLRSKWLKWSSRNETCNSSSSSTRPQGKICFHNRWSRLLWLLVSFVFAWPCTNCFDLIHSFSVLVNSLMNCVIYRCRAATLSEWNVVIYGTKESPDAPDASPPSAVLQQKQPEKQQHQQQEQQQMTPKKADDVPVANQPPPLISKLTDWLVRLVLIRVGS